jgi:hypothetical protein
LAADILQMPGVNAHGFADSDYQLFQVRELFYRRLLFEFGDFFFEFFDQLLEMFFVVQYPCLEGLAVSFDNFRDFIPY